jgi:hypothetical protein
MSVGETYRTRRTWMHLLAFEPAIQKYKKALLIAGGSRKFVCYRRGGATESVSALTPTLMAKNAAEARGHG